MLTEILIFVFTSLTVYYLYVYKKLHYHFKSRGLKYLPGVPLFGNAFNSTVLRKHIIDDLDAVYKAFPGERYVGYIEGIAPIILIRDPEIIKMITVKDFDHFVNHREFFSEDIEPLFGGSLFMMKGDRWRDMRTTLSPAFTGSKMRLMMPFMQEISKNIVEDLKDHLEKDIYVDDLMQRYTNDVIASAAFGLKVNSLKDRDNEFFRMGQSLFKFNWWQRFYFFFAEQFPGVAKKMKVQIFPEGTTRFFKDIVSNTMEYREKNKVVRPDMIQLLMEAVKGTLNAGNAPEKDDTGFATGQEEIKHNTVSREWTQNELVGQVFIFFVAGFETSSTTVTLCLHELTLNPDIQEKLYQEIRGFVETRKTLTYENISELKYLDCVLNETLRKWAAAIIMDRECNKTYDLPPPHEGGKPYRLNPGDVVYNVVNSIHMDPQYWPEPEVFNPDRFSEENKHNIKPFTFMPFGMGPRACIGLRFALMELKVLLFNIVLNYKLVKSKKTLDPIKLLPLDFNLKANAIMLTEILILVLTTLIIYYVYVYKKIHYYFKERGLKYLPGVPLFGNAFKSTILRKHVIDEMHEVYRAFPGERYVGFVDGITPIILIRDPELVKMITVKDFDHFVNHREFFHEQIAPLLAGSLFFMKGDRWRDMRTTLSPAFTGSKMRLMMPFMQEISKNIIEDLKEHSAEDIDLEDLMCRYTSDVIASAAFGLQVNSLKDRDNEFFRMGQGLFKLGCWQRFFFFFSTHFPELSKKMKINIFPKRMTQFFQDLISKTIEFRETNKVVRPDMIQLLMEAAKGTLNAGSSGKDDIGFATVDEEVKHNAVTREWTQNEIVGQVFIFFVAGFETSSSSVTLCLHELALKPDVQERLYQEIREFEETKKSLTYENINVLKYLDCVLNETLRKWTAAFVMDRVCNKTYYLPPPHEGGKTCRIMPGEIVYSSVNSIHMDPQYWPEPEVFNPDRFSEENKHNIKPFTFMPFGMGPRACIGSRFALLELKVLVFNVVLHFKILKCKKTVEPIKLKALDFEIKADGGSWVRLEARS
ncbi:hypothetical protein ABMA28_015253 [Loxostege sticticalis]|uniref:unspecific monooxygenase n=1 Tax=Loxostege sticticalis TaxID=481309 RepID=A0ABD0TET0_LOXSC